MDESKDNKRYETVGALDKICIFPLKSGKRTELTEANCTYSGLCLPPDIYDRQWMVIREGGQFVTARQFPPLCLVSLTFDGPDVLFDAPGMETLRISKHLPREGTTQRTTKVWDQDTVGRDCGDQASQWISKYLKKEGMRILYSADDLPQRDIYNEDKAKDVDKVKFQDGYPYMLMAESSVQDLNTHFSDQQAYSPMNFRGNFLVSGTTPYDEDSWDEVIIGDVKFKNLKPCDRCIFTTINCETGQKDPNMQPLKEMRTYRPKAENSPWLGINLVVEKPGVVRVGGLIRVTRK